MSVRSFSGQSPLGYRADGGDVNTRSNFRGSAAMLMWLETEPDVQAKYLARVFDAELKSGVAAAVAEAKGEQRKKIARREQRQGRAG